MKRRNIYVAVLVLGNPALAFAAQDDIGSGGDKDGPTSQPPGETDTASGENLLQELLEWFGVDIE